MTAPMLCGLCQSNMFLNAADGKWLCSNKGCKYSGWDEIERRKGPPGRKVIQVTTAPLNTFTDDQGATGTVNAVFAVCDDGTVWIQMLGDGSDGGWMPVDDVPQGDFDELNAASQDEASGD